jgi:hypothetical protein
MKYNAVELLSSFNNEIRDFLALDYPGYLDAMSSCFNHSYINAFLVRKAMPDAVMVADELSWMNVYNREVTVKRDSGIPIVVPGVMFRSDERVSDGRLMIRKVAGQEPERFESVKVNSLIFYPKIEVLYDISQTTGADIKKLDLDARNWDKSTEKALQKNNGKLREDDAFKTSILYVIARHFKLSFESDSLGEFGRLFSTLSLEDLRTALYKIQTNVCELIHQIVRQRTFNIEMTPSLKREF